MTKLLTFDDFMGLSLTTFEKFGCKSANKSIWRSIYFWTSMFILLLYLIFFSVFKNENFDDNLQFLSVSRDIASVAVQGSFLLKTFSLLFQNYEKIRECFEKLRTLFPKKLEDQKKYKIYNDYKVVHFKNNFILIIYIWNTIISSLIPLFATFYRYFFGDGIYQITFAIHFRFNFNLDQFLIKEIILALLIWNNIFCCAVTIAVDVIYISTLSALCMQFKVFTQQISEIDFKFPETKKKLVEHKNKICEMIKQHVELIKLSDLVDEIFSPMILINLINGAVILCFLGFEILVTIFLHVSKINSILIVELF